MTGSQEHNPEELRFKLGEGVGYYVEDNGLLLVNSNRTETEKLNQKESALWHLNAYGMHPESLMNFFSILYGSDDEAQNFVSKTLLRWHSEGYLRRR